jgi:hypothetical protein
MSMSWSVAVTETNALNIPVGVHQVSYNFAAHVFLVGGVVVPVEKMLAEWMPRAADAEFFQSRLPPVPEDGHHG